MGLCGMKKIIFAVLFVALGIWQYDQNKVITHPDGVLAADDPAQRYLDSAPAFEFKGYMIKPMATFSIEARVLSREKYHLGRESELSPIDFALGWGPMSDTAVLSKIDISQGGRFYYWRAERPPIPLKQIVSHSSNMHMVPSSNHVAKQLASVRKGNVVSLKGHLININAADGWRWRSSLVRTDTGGGACELVWVDEVVIL